MLQTVSLLLCTLLGCLLVVPALCAEAPLTAAQLWKQGADAVTLGKVDEAKHALEELRARYPDAEEAPQAAYFLGKVYMALKDEAKYRALMDEIAQRWPESEAYVGICNEYLAYHWNQDLAATQQLLATMQQTNTSAAARTLVKQYQLYVLGETAPEKLVEEWEAWMQQVNGTTPADTVYAVGGLGGPVYAYLARRNQVDKAKSLHETWQTKLAFIGNAFLIRGDNTTYFSALARYNKSAYLAQVQPMILAAKWAETRTELEDAVNWAADAYPLYFAAKREADAKTIHELLVAALAKVEDTAPLAATESHAYLNAIVAADPERFWEQVQPQLAKFKSPIAPEQAADMIGLAHVLYAPLMRNGRFDEVKAIHAQVQALLRQAGDTEGMAADAKLFTDSISLGALDAMFALFKRAVAANDRDTAARWLAQLNTIAPEDPRAIKAREISKELK